MQQMIDFAGSDAPLTDDQLAKAPARVLHFPAALGADVVAYNLPKNVAPARLRLTGPVVAEYLSRQDHQMERSSDYRAEPGAQTAGDRHRSVSSIRWERNDVHFHRLFVQG